MSDPLGDILQDMLQTLRQSGLFAVVSLGNWGSETAVPRAAIEFLGLETFHPDDTPDTRWVRLRAKVVIRTRSQDESEAARRMCQLCQAAMSSLLADPYRGGRCDDSSVGRATEADDAEVNTLIRRPEVEAGFMVRCHFDEALSGGAAMSSLDGQDVFSSGSHSFKVAPWQRQLQRRTFPGPGGELIVDMGIGARAIVQAGRLRAATSDALSSAVAAIETFIDGRTHTLVDRQGQTHYPVILEQFELTTPIRVGRAYWCDYTCRYLQLPS